jgi:hypothetical protein
MTFNEQMKQKAEEVHLQEKAKEFGDAVAEVVRAAVSAFAGLAEENRPKVDAMLDKAEQTIVEKAGAKHADTVVTVRGQVDRGIDKLVAQRGGATPAGPSQPAQPTGTTQPTASSSGQAVPDDTFTAFPDDDESAGSPS